MTFVFLIIIFMPYICAAVFSLFINICHPFWLLPYEYDQGLFYFIQEMSSATTCSAKKVAYIQSF